jgi:type IV pilus assembly protein PilN
MTTRINLLPWREEMRKSRERNFYAMLAVAAAVGAGIWLLAHAHLAGRIEFQTARNDYLQQEMANLDRKIVKIRDLESTKKKLIARMNVIQELQQGRPQIVHLFNQFVTTLPDGLYLTGIKESGDSLNITGVAESNSRVSSYMENLENSHWLSDPELTVIEVEERSDLRVSNFELTVKEAKPKAEKGEETAG